MHRFILQARHPEYGCPAFETMFTIQRLEDLQVLLGPDARRDPEIRQLYWLEPADLAAIYQRFGVTFEAGDHEVSLVRWQALRATPYLVHTGYELPLLLDGREKLARFHDEYPPHEHGWEEQFDRFVAQGLLHKEVDVERFDKPHRFSSGHVIEGLRTAWYTPPGEEWRIQAFRLITKTRGSWNETLERLEGMLYGYDDGKMTGGPTIGAASSASSAHHSSMPRLRRRSWRRSSMPASDHCPHSIVRWR